MLVAGCATKQTSPSDKVVWNCQSYGGLLNLGQRCTQAPKEAPQTVAAQTAPEFIADTPEIAPYSPDDEVALNDQSTPEMETEEAPPAHPVNGRNSAEEQLMKLMSHYYAVQVVSLSTEDNLNRFLKENNLFEKAYLRTWAKGQAWYVVIFGVYEDYSKAKRVLESIPYRFKTKAWIRSVGSLQEAMKEFERQQGQNDDLSN